MVATQEAHSSAAVVDGWPISLTSVADALDSICDAAQRGLGFSVCTLNLDHLVKLRRDLAFQDAYRAARFVTADGAPIVWLARQSGAKLERATGADLLIPLAKLAAHHGLSVYLFGATPDVLQLAGRSLRATTDGVLNICGAASPSGRFDPQGPEADAAIEQIKASGARLCFLALGAPKQEIFAARALAQGANVGFVSIGAGLDFLAGRQVRAPQILRSAGIEWMWRLALNPRRMFKRYLDCALVLADLAVVAPLQQRFGGQISGTRLVAR